MTPRKLNAQPLYLEPDKADSLDQLSAEIKIPKAVLLREAVDDFLAMHGKGATPFVDLLRDALQKSHRLVLKLENMTAREAVWQRKCYEAERAIEDALAELGSTWRHSK